MPPSKDNSEEVYPPVLTQDGSVEEVSCDYDEELLSGYVDFASVVIHFDYEGYFIPNANSVASVKEVEHIIFKYLGEKAGLLKKPKPASSTTLEVSDISCMGLLGDFNVTKKVPGLRPPSPPKKGNRYTKAKMKDGVFMLGLSSLPLDQVETLNEQETASANDGECKIELSKKKRDELPDNGICRTVHAVVTAYIATAGNGTIVDPIMLEESTAKYLRKEINKGKFVTDSIPYMTFVGIRQPTDEMELSEAMIISQANQDENADNPANSINNPQNEQGQQDNVLSQMGTYFIALFAMAVLGTFFVFARRMKQRKSRHQEVEKSDDSSSSDCHSPICSVMKGKGSIRSIGVQNYDISQEKHFDNDNTEDYYISCKSTNKRGNETKKNETIEEVQSFETIKNNQSLSSENTLKDEVDEFSDIVSVSSHRVEVKAPESMCCFVY